ncbi:MAG: hypothetical protein IJD58_12890 [Lachnospiraceae bacterium]|nr:hypothetical protein [Lachnospiraceae bacterium]
MKKIKDLLTKNNYFIGKILGGVAAVVVILIIILINVDGEENKEDRNTTSTQGTNQIVLESTDEGVTLKDAVIQVATLDMESGSSTEIVEEGSDVETTLVADEEMSEEVTTKTAAEIGKETTSKKEEKTTKKNDATTKQQTSKETTTKKQTTTVKSTTTKQETTTEEQTTEKKPQKVRLKECELELISRRINYEVNGQSANIYESEAGKYNPYITEREFGWENAAMAVHPSEMYLPDYYQGDYFYINYPNDEYERNARRDIYLKKKITDEIYRECEEWVKNPSKYGMEDKFGEYLSARFSRFNKYTNSIYTEITYRGPGIEGDIYDGGTKEWCEKWAYFDTVLQRYRTMYSPYCEFYSRTYVKEGYFTDVGEVISYLKNYENVSLYITTCYCRWIYDEEINKTIVYIVEGI